MEGASKPRLGADSFFLEVLSVINHRVASVALLDLSTSNGTSSRTINMVERCYTSWQGGNVSGERGLAQKLNMMLMFITFQ